MTASTAHKKHGAAHFVQERVSSAALGVLAPLFAVLLVLGVDGSTESVLAWLKQPFNAWLTGAFLAVSVWHMAMGLDVIIDDYIAAPATNRLLRALNYLVCAITAGAGLFALYHLLSGGAVS